MPDQVYGLFLSLLTASGSMDARMAAFENGSAWFGAWAEAGHGDVSPNEMAIIVEQVWGFFQAQRSVCCACYWPCILLWLAMRDHPICCPKQKWCTMAPADVYCNGTRMPFGVFPLGS